MNTTKIPDYLISGAVVDVADTLAPSQERPLAIDRFYSVALSTAVCAGLAGSPLATAIAGSTAVVAGRAAKRIDARGVAALAAMGMGSVSHSAGAAPSLVTPAVAALAAAIAAHKIPGFRNWAWLQETRLRPDAIPYTSYVNGDKALVGAMLLCSLQHAVRPGVTLNGLLGATSVGLGTIGALMVAATQSGFVAFDPYPPSPSLAAVWALNNLLLVAAPEEALFRGILQEGLTKGLGGSTWAQAGALVVASGLFGCAHLPGGAHYAALSALAGVGYGLAAQMTGRLEAAIVAHFALNLVHFLFFTYPMRARRASNE